MSGFLKGIALALTLGSMLAASALPAQTDNYPSKSITIMPLLAAGTGLDIAVRLYGEELSKSLGKARSARLVLDHHRLAEALG